MCFNIIISDADDGTVCPQEVCRMYKTGKCHKKPPYGCVAVQRDVSNLEKWASSWSSVKCKVVQLGRNNPVYHTDLRTDGQENSLVEEVLRGLWGPEDERDPAGWESQCVLDCVRNCVASRLEKKMILPVYAALVGVLWPVVSSPVKQRQGCLWR